MLWINFLHIYQPSTLDRNLLIKIANDSYLNIIETLKKNSQYKITLNIAGCLTEYLYQAGFGKLIKEISWLAEKGQIELTATAAFHPILPLIPLKEVIKQITINNEINKKYFGEAYRPRGFYFPEMAYSFEVAKRVKKIGYDWIILDEIALNGQINERQSNHDRAYKIKNIGLRVVFRNRKISKSFVPETIENILALKERPDFVITATDGELYGHKYIDNEKKLERVLNDKNLTTATITEFLANERKVRAVDLLACSWETTVDDLKKNIPYSLWKNPKNNIHHKLWQLADLALILNYKYSHDQNYYASRLHLERGLASCTFWWASGKDFKLFESRAWSPEEIEKGARELLKSIRSLQKIDGKIKIKAEKIFAEIHKMIWAKHWKIIIK